MNTRLPGIPSRLNVFLLAAVFLFLLNAQPVSASFLQEESNHSNSLLPGSNRFKNEVSNLIYLPNIIKDYHSPGLYGYVTNQGIPIQGIHIVLSYYDGSGSGWQVYDQKITNSDGYYLFSNIPSLESGKYYSILYNNGQDGNPQNPLYLESWSKFITEYNGDFLLGDSFDLASPVLLSPSSGSSLQLPITFTWTGRPWSPSDYYRVYIMDIDPTGPVHVSPTNIYDTQYILTELPPYFSYNYTYRWDVAVFNGNGGVGFMLQENRHLITLLP